MLKKILCLTTALLLYSNLFVVAQVNSLRQALDSLEVELLKTTSTYEQIDRLIQAIPLQSHYLNALPSVFPVVVSIQEFAVSSPFGLRKHPINHNTKLYSGIDVKAPEGLAVKATAPGIVRRIGYDPGLGAFMEVIHAFGFQTQYGHLAGYYVQPGARVERGDELGKVGRTGLTTGPHLHYVIKKNGQAIDPLHFCYLLRRRLWLHQRDNGSGGDTTSSFSSGSKVSKEQ